MVNIIGLKITCKVGIGSLIYIQVNKITVHVERGLTVLSLSYIYSSPTFISIIQDQESIHEATGLKSSSRQLAIQLSDTGQ